MGLEPKAVELSVANCQNLPRYKAGESGLRRPHYLLHPKRPALTIQGWKGGTGDVRFF